MFPTLLAVALPIIMLSLVQLPINKLRVLWVGSLAGIAVRGTDFFYSDSDVTGVFVCSILFAVTASGGPICRLAFAQALGRFVVKERTSWFELRLVFIYYLGVLCSMAFIQLLHNGPIQGSFQGIDFVETYHRVHH